MPTWSIFAGPVTNTSSPIDHSSSASASDCLDYILAEELNDSQNRNSIDDSNSRALALGINERFQRAFGASLLYSEGGCYDDPWYKLWARLFVIKNCHYDLPSGSVGRDFVNLLSSEINLLGRGSSQSERVLVFLSAMLQWDPKVWKGTDICRLLDRRLQNWKKCNFENLVTEVEWCSRQLHRSGIKDKNDHYVMVFTRLMLRGQVRSAVRFITDRIHGGGVMPLDASTGVPGYSGLDILRKKHPDPGVIDESAFSPCDVLPPLIDLDITADYVEHVACHFQGSAGPGGSTALQWHGYLLQYGLASAHLQDAVAMLARHLANGIVEWESICALMVSRLDVCYCCFPLICSLNDPQQWIQNWYADDSSCIRVLSSVRQWFKKLV